MTEAVLSINVNEPAGEVLRLFAGYPVHHLPVLSDQKVVGMLSTADVMKIQAFIPKTGLPPDVYLSKHLDVATLMRKPAITIRAHATLLEAATLMARHGVHALPIVNEHDRLLGIITTTDIMHAALGPQPASPVTAPESTGHVPLQVQMSPPEFQRALAAARAAIGRGEDVNGIAMGLMYMCQRLVSLEHVLQHADRYLHLGESSSQKAALRTAVANAKSLQSIGGSSYTDSGLA